MALDEVCSGALVLWPRGMASGELERGRGGWRGEAGAQTYRFRGQGQGQRGDVRRPALGVTLPPRRVPASVPPPVGTAGRPHSGGAPSSPPLVHYGMHSRGPLAGQEGARHARRQFVASGGRAHGTGCQARAGQRCGSDVWLHVVAEVGAAGSGGGGGGGVLPARRSTSVLVWLGGVSWFPFGVRWRWSAKALVQP